MPVSASEHGLAQLMKKLADKPVHYANFIEERHAFYLDTPLKTQGYLKATPPDQLEKDIISPEPIQQVISGDIIRHNKKGEVVREMILSQQPVLAAAINAMRAVLFGNVDYLKKHFQVKFKNEHRHWQLFLIPQEERIVKYIKSIMISGVDENVSEFLITEANGDYSKTRLYEVKK